MDPFLLLIIWFVLSTMSVSIGWVFLLIRQYFLGILFGVVIPVLLTDPLVTAHRAIPLPVTWLDHIGPTIFIWLILSMSAILGFVPVSISVLENTEFEKKKRGVITLSDGTNAEVVEDTIIPLKKKN